MGQLHSVVLPEAAVEVVVEVVVEVAAVLVVAVLGREQKQAAGEKMLSRHPNHRQSQNSASCQVREIVTSGRGGFKDSWGKDEARARDGREER